MCLLWVEFLTGVSLGCHAGGFSAWFSPPRFLLSGKETVLTGDLFHVRLHGVAECRACADGECVFLGRGLGDCGCVFLIPSQSPPLLWWVDLFLLLHTI